jgi:transposase
VNLGLRQAAHDRRHAKLLNYALVLARQGLADDFRSLAQGGEAVTLEIKGHKRHISVDTLGLLLGVSVHAADIQDRDCAHEFLRDTRRRFSFVQRIFADGGYQGPKMAKTVAATGCWKIEIVKHSDLHRFVILPKRWIVERTFAWISRNRRLMRDFERYTKTADFVRLAIIRIMLRRLTRSTQCS